MKKHVAIYKETPIAWAPDALVRAINRYGEKYKATLISCNETKYGESDQSIQSPDVPISTNLDFSQFDLVHFNNHAIHTTKPHLIQFHSVPNFTDYQFQGMRLVIAQFHATLPEYSDCRIVRNILDLEDPVYTVPRDPAKIRIGFSPSTIVPRGTVNNYSNKGYYETVDILRGLQAKCPYVEVDIIKDVGIAECLQRKSQCNIQIDECVTKSYHRCALEGLAFGALTICSLGDDVAAVLRRATGSDTIPFLNVQLVELPVFLKNLVARGPEHINSVGVESRKWMLKYWDPRSIVAEFEAIYDELLHTYKAPSVSVQTSPPVMQSTLAAILPTVDIIIPSCKRVDNPQVIQQLEHIKKTRVTPGQIIFTGIKQSAAVNRNAGLLRAQTQIVIMLDDDITDFTPGWDLRLVTPLLENPELMIVSARFREKSGGWHDVMGNVLNYDAPYVHTLHNLTPTATIAFRKSDIKFDETYIGSGYEDTDFCLQMQQKFPRKKVAIVNLCVLTHLHEAKEQHIHIPVNRKYFQTKWQKIMPQICRYV